MLSFKRICSLNRMMTEKLTIMLAMALVFGQLQCAAWCTVSACSLPQLSEAESQNVPPCHRHQTDSNHSSPASPCSHGALLANVASFSAAQAPVSAPLEAIPQVQPEANTKVLISGNESAALITSPPGSSGPSSFVLRI
jgi:hypothetical protein